MIKYSLSFRQKIITNKFDPRKNFCNTNNDEDEMYRNKINEGKKKEKKNFDAVETKQNS